MKSITVENSERSGVHREVRLETTKDNKLIIVPVAPPRTLICYRSLYEANTLLTALQGFNFHKEILREPHILIKFVFFLLLDTSYKT